MFWKLSRKEFEAGKGEPNRLAQKINVSQGRIPGLMAYVDTIPAGWIAVEPRDEFSGLARSRVLAPYDDAPVWSVPCFFVARKYRGIGLTVALLKAAIDYVSLHGGKVVEGYPIEPKQEKAPPVFIYTGVASAFKKAGFTEVIRRSETRPIMRYMME